MNTMPSLSKQETETFISHVTAIDVPETNIPLKCNTGKLVHVQIWNQYTLLCGSSDLNGINNVIRSTAIHIHIIGTCPWTNMSAIYTGMLHSSAVVVYIYITHMSTVNNLKNQKKAALFYHAMVIYMPAMNMPLKCHIYVMSYVLPYMH